ncbi:MAG: GNAT family N-acetyltransferase [Oscillospiraceae bacterium]|nr:GNAT family N-acetyltransferase [Oscillospiraceae bacterium]
MDITFNKVSDFKKGIFTELLSDAYSFDNNIVATYKEKWLDDDEFFFDNPDIADYCGFISTLGDEIIGFVMCDPRNMPEYAIVGDNCIITKHKGKGYGKLQLQEAINRFAQKGTKKFYVSTSSGLTPAQKMYESVGFMRLDISKLEPWQIEQKQDIYYRLDLCTK